MFHAAHPPAELLELRQYLSISPSIAGPATIASGSTYTLDLSYTGTTPSSWTVNWGDGGGTPDTQTVSGSPTSVTHTFTTSGASTYDITATASDGTTNYTAAQTINASFGQSGQASAFFNGSGYDTANAITTDSSGDVLAAGTTVDPTTGDVSIALSRFCPDGSYDTSFNGDGLATTDTGGTEQVPVAMAIEPSDGKIIVVGGVADFGFSIFRFNTDGSLDTSFNEGGSNFLATSTPLQAEAVAIAPSGDIVVAGANYSAEGTPEIAMMEFYSDGEIDTDPGSGSGVATIPVADYPSAVNLAISSSGKIIVATGVDTTVVIAQLNSNGSVDTGFNSGSLISDDLGEDAPVNVRQLSVDGSGNITAVGDAPDPFDGSDIFLEGVTSTGAVEEWSGSTPADVVDSFSSTATIDAITPTSSGGYMAIGSTSSDQTVSQTYDSDLNLDTSYGQDGTLSVAPNGVCACAAFTAPSAAGTFVLGSGFSVEDMTDSSNVQTTASTTTPILYFSQNGTGTGSSSSSPLPVSQINNKSYNTARLVETFTAAITITLSNITIDGSDSTSPATLYPTSGHNALVLNGGSSITVENLSVNGSDLTEISATQFDHGIYGLNTNSITINNCTLTASGSSTGFGDGIALENNQSSVVTGATVSNCVVSYAQENGIFVGLENATASSVGFDTVMISGCTAHNDGITSNAAIETGVISYTTPSGTATQYANLPAPNFTVNTDVTITNCVAYDNRNNGIFMNYSLSSTVEDCLTFANGASDTGNTGIYGVQDKDVTFDHCESYGNVTGSGSGYSDGDGFDFDWGCVDCTMEYNYAHGNDGGGFCLFGACVDSGGTEHDYPPNTGCIIRYNISACDGLYNNYAGIFMRSHYGFGTWHLSSASIYNNTIYVTSTGSSGGTPSGIYYDGVISSLTIANNIVISSGSATLIDGTTSQPSLTIGHNDYYALSSFRAYFSGSESTSFSSYSSNESSSLNDDPEITWEGLTSWPGTPSNAPIEFNDDLTIETDLNDYFALGSTSPLRAHQGILGAGVTLDFFGNSIITGISGYIDIGTYQSLSDLVLTGGTGTTTYYLSESSGTLTSTAGTTPTNFPLAALDVLTISSGNYTVAAPTAANVAFTLPALTLQSTAKLAFATASNITYGTVFTTSGLTIGSSATLDLGGNDMIWHGGTESNVRSSLNAGFNSGTWDGAGGIISSTAASTVGVGNGDITGLGYELNNNGSGGVFFSTFDGQLVTNTDLLVKYTFFGDANLSGHVDTSDYTRLDNGYNNGLSGWANGAFDYVEYPNTSDYTIIDNSYNHEGSTTY